jgi:uncharacterized protein (DUF1501 family)
MKRTPTLSRRSFLHGSGTTLAGFGLASLVPGGFVRHALAGTDTQKKLMFIFLRGGNDGLNTLIPHGDPDYNATHRPTLYIPPEDAIDLNGFASFHPSLADLMDIFDAGELAAAHRVGYPDASLSHFDGQRIWENGDPLSPFLYEGWLYRYIQENAVSQGAALPVVTVQGQAPVLVRGDESYVNIANPDQFDYPHDPPKRDKYAAAWQRRYEQLIGPEAYRAALADTGLTLLDTLDEYRSWDQAHWNPTDPDDGYALFPVDEDTDPEGRFDGQAYDFFKQLKVCALSLLENDDTRLAGTQLGGWDHHDEQGSTQGVHAAMLSWLAYGMRSLRLVLSRQAIDDRTYPDIWNDTVVTTMSEFGRTSAENGSLGSDHAKAGCVLIAGGRVNGGVYNCDASTWPAGVMFGIEERYLLESTDYRAVFWEILRDHMGADPGTVDTIFPGYSALGLEELGLLTG